MKLGLLFGIAAGSVAALASVGFSGRQAASMLPMSEGAQWSYTDTIDNRKSPRTTTVWAQEDADGRTVYELRAVAQYPGYEYWNVESDGIYGYQNTNSGGPGFESKSRFLILRLPAVKSDSWTWESVAQFQSGGGGRGKPITYTADQLRVNHTATVESTDDPVDVPAGKFKAVKVVETSVGKMHRETVTTRWFVEGVGLVKQIQTREGAGSQTRVLTGHRDGKPFSDPVAKAWEFSGIPEADVARYRAAAEDLRFASEEAGRLRKAVKSDAPEMKAAVLRLREAEAKINALPQTKEIVHGAISNTLRSRFFKILPKGQIIRVLDGEVSLFDPLSKDSWKRVFAEEQQWNQERDLGLSFISPAASVLATHALGLKSKDYLVMGGEETKVNGDEITSVATTRGIISKDKMWAMDLTMVFKDREVEKVTYKIKE